MVAEPVASLLSLSIGLLPVLIFLAALIPLDSFKLVRFRSVVGAILVGCAIAVACLWINGALMRSLGVSAPTFTRYWAPVVEEVAKAVWVIVLIRRRRVGFVVDAAILGFAVGAGFALIENVYYFRRFDDPALLVWTIRGFGTAIMHGGATALAGIVCKYLSDRHGARPAAVLPGVGAAILAHAFFNHFAVPPLLATLGLLFVLPLSIATVFRASERATRHWLGTRFDTDQELLEMINTGKVSESRVGTYFATLQSRFAGEVVVDMVCLLKLHLELSIRAKGILLMREAGFDPEGERDVEDRLRELRHLEKSIGLTGRRAVAPILNMSERELWQLNMLAR
jgi:RsiW-degrading membrane proteinase PrsW (M82 family)